VEQGQLAAGTLRATEMNCNIRHVTHLSCRAILFDLDGVLVDSRAAVERQWSLWAERRGLDLEPILAVAHGRRSEDVIALVAPELDADAEARLVDEAETRDLAGVVPAPGALELVSDLPGGSWTIVTSGSRSLATARLRHIGLPVPPCLVAGDDVGIGKPDPAGYLAAAASLDVQPRDCVVIEDAGPGIEAARAAGMTVIAVTTTLPVEELAAADFVVDSVRQITVAGRLDGELSLELTVSAQRG
jgi:mannitol-1-/sugar-/sorbitol-6-phosphatase